MSRRPTSPSAENIRDRIMTLGIMTDTNRKTELLLRPKSMKLIRSNENKNTHNTTSGTNVPKNPTLSGLKENKNNTRPKNEATNIATKT
jgi:hypothetical protein